MCGSRCKTGNIYRNEIRINMSTEKFKRLIKKHTVVLLILLFTIFVYKCPFNYFLNIPCPGCGITRAYLAAFSLNFRQAFEYHPLFFTVAPTILYTAHRDVLKYKFSYKFEKIYYASLICMFGIVYIIRQYV